MDMLTKAIFFATKAHEGQMRKRTNTPYILHPIEVASIIATITDDQDIMAAGVLHDVIEDCGIEPATIKELFGPRVSALVQSDSEDRLDPRPASETWMDRKNDSLLMLKHTKDIGVKIMWMGDKLSNMRSLYRAYRRYGKAEMWSCFHQKDPAKQEWYYRTIAEYLADLKDTIAYREYMTLMEEVFG